jgi:hypothetical protein
VVEEFAKNQRADFFILSGLLGFLPAGIGVPYYDHHLTEEEILELSGRVHNQLVARGISEVCFYTKKKISWVPYGAVLGIAAAQCGVRVCFHYLKDD